MNCCEFRAGGMAFINDAGCFWETGQLFPASGARVVARCGTTQGKTICSNFRIRAPRWDRNRSAASCQVQNRLQSRLAARVG